MLGDLPVWDLSDLYKSHDDKKITSDYYAFTISKSLFFKADKINNKTYSFKLHETDKLAHKLMKSVTINPINKETSILKLNIKATNPKKNINILNKLTNIYIRNSLDEKNIMAVNTILFIDEQLSITKDSLRFIEDQLKAFN